MPATPYKPTTFAGDALVEDKLKQMANNDQWLFENTPRVRYAAAGLTKDTGQKTIVGKTRFSNTGGDAADVFVYFGSYFSAGCKPIVDVTVETTGGRLRKFACIRGIGNEVDYRGFVAHISTHERAPTPNNIEAGGWIHWNAVGY